MRKRSHRRHWAPVAHPLLAPITPLAAAELLDLQLQEHQALDALGKGCAARAHLRTLMTSAAVAHELARHGYGKDELDQLGQVLQVLGSQRSQESGRASLDATGLQAVAWMLAFHDAQREAVSRADYHRSLLAVGRNPGQWGICAG